MKTPGGSPGVTNRSDWLNAPNLIASARIVATPFFVWMLVAENGQNLTLRWLAAAFFVVAIATDALDGWLARRNNQITDLGKLLDPIADKFLTGAAFVSLSIIGELPWWVTALVLLREIGITVHRLAISGRTVVAAERLGKFKTLAQAVALVLAIAPLAQTLGTPMILVNTGVMTVAVVLTVVSGIEYIAARRQGRG